jgi:50S ribosomal subunit-associated GTPase HflX
VYVFNKTDAIPDFNKEVLAEKYKDYSPIFISVKNEDGIADVKECIKNSLLEK